MAAAVSVTFDVEICDGANREDATMTIFEKHIEFSKTREKKPFSREYKNNHFRKTTKIKFKKLSHILLNNSGKEYKDKYKARSFGLKHNGVVLNFMTKHKWERDTILLEILNRCTRNNINPSHRESIKWATSEVALNVLEIEGFNPVPRGSIYTNPEWKRLFEREQRLSAKAAVLGTKKRLKMSISIMSQQVQALQKNEEMLQRLRGEQVTEHRRVQSDALIDTVQRVNTEKPAKSEPSQRSKMNDHDEQNEIQKQREELQRQREELQRD